MTNKKIAVFWLFVGLVLVAQSAHAQVKQENQPGPLTNQAVVEMLKAGVTPADVIFKIKTSSCDFDTSPKALRALRKSRVPDVVMTAILEANARANAGAAVAASATDMPIQDVKKVAANGGSYPECIHCPRPNYATEARNKKIQGVVMLEVVITPEGRATHIKILRGPGYGLEEQAVEAVTSWKFKPAKNSEGVPVAVMVTVEVNFRLN